MNVQHWPSLESEQDRDCHHSSVVIQQKYRNIGIIIGHLATPCPHPLDLPGSRKPTLIMPGIIEGMLHNVDLLLSQDLLPDKNRRLQSTKRVMLKCLLNYKVRRVESTVWWVTLRRSCCRTIRLQLKIYRLSYKMTAGSMGMHESDATSCILQETGIRMYYFGQTWAQLKSNASFVGPYLFIAAEIPKGGCCIALAYQ